VDAIVCLLTDTIDAAVLDAAGPQLTVVANVAVGYNNIDVAACRARGIAVTNTPDVLTNACADFTWGLILAITRRLGEGERVGRAGAWGGWALDYMLGMELRGKQLGLVGLGRIGRAVAEGAGVWLTVAYRADPADLPGATRCRWIAAGDLRRRVAALPDDAADEAPDRPEGADQDEAVGVPDQHVARARGR
jgi:glyoxylate reductase